MSRNIRFQWIWTSSNTKYQNIFLISIIFSRGDRFEVNRMSGWMDEINKTKLRVQLSAMNRQLHVISSSYSAFYHILQMNNKQTANNYIPLAKPRLSRSLDYPNPEKDLHEPIQNDFSCWFRQSTASSSIRSSSSQSSNFSKSKYRRSFPLSVRFEQIPEEMHPDEDNDDKDWGFNDTDANPYRQTIIDRIINISGAETERKPVDNLEGRYLTEDSNLWEDNKKATKTRCKLSLDQESSSSLTFSDDNLRQLRKMKRDESDDPRSTDKKESNNLQLFDSCPQLDQKNPVFSLPHYRLPAILQNTSNMLASTSREQNWFGGSSTFYRIDITARIQDESFVFMIFLMKQQGSVNYLLKTQKYYPRDDNKKYDVTNEFTIEVFWHSIRVTNILRGFSLRQPFFQGKYEQLQTTISLSDPSAAKTFRANQSLLEPLCVSWSQRGRKI